MSVIECKTTEQFNEFINSGKLVMVDFYATWCGPCKVIAPEVEKLAAEHASITFIKVDVDKLDDVAEEQGITAMPTFRFFKDGAKNGNDVLGADLDAIKAAIIARK